MSRLRLLVVSPSLGGGGAERFVSTVLQHLDRSRFRPHLCLLREEVTYVLPTDVEVTVLHKRSPFQIPRTILRLRRLILESRPDVVLGNMLATDWLIGAALQGLPGAPRWVARFAVPTGLGAPEWERRVGPALRFFVRGADSWVANSRALAADLRRWTPGGSPPVATILNPVDIADMDASAAAPLESGWPGPRPRLLWVGRLEAQKRPDVLLDAFVRVRSRVGGSLCVLGDGSLLARCRRDAARLGLSEHVRFVGFDRNPYRWMARADAFLMTSDFEGLPNALLEAQGMGLAAVSTDCPTGPAEIVQDGVTGRLVPPGDHRALGDAAAEILEDERLRQAMGQAARARIRSRHDPGLVVRQWERLLSDAAADPSSGRDGDSEAVCAE